MRTVAVATRGKGLGNAVRRARAIGSRYGLSSGPMRRRLEHVLRLTEPSGHAATLPVTASAFARHPGEILRASERGIEFAVHGLHHIDHADLPASPQIEHLRRARELLERHGLPAAGFRAPYLRWNEATMLALRETGYAYDSSQAMHWPLGSEVDEEVGSDAYDRGLAFCGSLSAAAYPVLPRLEDGLVRIPVCLPDDESLIDRLAASPQRIETIWLGVLRRTLERGELFTMQVHPERIEPCALGVSSVLGSARAARPAVWIARLDELARWWRERAEARVELRDAGRGEIDVAVAGPKGVRILARNLPVTGGRSWAADYVLAPDAQLRVPAGPRPFIGVHPSSDRSLLAFLRQQGFIVETAASGREHSCFLRRERFSREDELPLLAEIDGGTSPLVRLGRWPDGARAALALTGDVDALTLWDYAFRFLGR